MFISPEISFIVSRVLKTPKYICMRLEVNFSRINVIIKNLVGEQKLQTRQWLQLTYMELDPAGFYLTC